MIEINEFEGYYALRDGNIYSSYSGKNLSTFVDNVGYRQVILYKNKKRHYKRVHRLIAIAYIQNINNYKQVNHINGVKTDNEVDNLEWSSNSQNTKHAYDNGMYLSTTSIQVKSICKETKAEQIHKSIRSCAESLGINRKTLSSILHDNKTNNYNYNFQIINKDM